MDVRAFIVEANRVLLTREDADEGRWTLKGDVLCWELNWYGASYGFKSACSAVRASAPGRLELRNEKAPDLSYMVARPL